MTKTYNDNWFKTLACCVNNFLKTTPQQRHDFWKKLNADWAEVAKNFENEFEKEVHSTPESPQKLIEALDEFIKNNRNSPIKEISATAESKLMFILAALGYTSVSFTSVSFTSLFKDVFDLFFKKDISFRSKLNAFKFKITDLLSNSKSIFIYTESKQTSIQALSSLLTLVIYIENKGKKDHLYDDPKAFAEEFNKLTNQFTNEPPDKVKVDEHQKREFSESIPPSARQETAADSPIYRNSTTARSSQPQQAAPSPKTNVPVSLILVFSSEHLPELQSLSTNKDKLAGNIPLLKKYQWYWFGATQETQSALAFESRENANMCWLRIDFSADDPNKNPGPLEITDLLNTIEKNTDNIRDVVAAQDYFDFGTSRMDLKGYKKK